MTTPTTTTSSTTTTTTTTIRVGESPRVEKCEGFSGGPTCHVPAFAAKNNTNKK